MIRIVLIGNEARKDAIHKLISARQNLHVQALGKDYFDAVKLVGKYHPDILLVDAALGAKGGEGILPSVKQYSPDTKIVVFGTRANDFPIRAMARGTLQSYLIFDSDFEHLEIILDDICRGNPYINSQLCREAFRYLAAYTRGGKTSPDAEKQLSPPFVELTKTELSALRLFALGKSGKEIAAALNITEGTVRNRFSFIRRKTGIKDRTLLLLYALGYGIPGSAELLPTDTISHLARPDNSP